MKLTSLVYPRVMTTLVLLQHLKIGFPGGSVAKNLPAKKEMGVRSLRWEDPLEQEMATHYRGDWQATAHRVSKDMTERLNNNKR